MSLIILLLILFFAAHTLDTVVYGSIVAYATMRERLK